MQHNSDGTSRTLGLSDIDIPFPSRLHPSSQLAGDRTKAIARAVDLLRPDNESRFDGLTDLAARFYPSTSEDGLLLGGLLLSWHAGLREACERDSRYGSDVRQVRELVRECLTVLAGGAAPKRAGPLHHSTRLLQERLVALSESEWRDRFFRALSDSLIRGTLELLEGWKEPSVPDVDTFLQRRLHDSAMLPCIDLHEPLAGFILPDVVLATPGFQEMRRRCARVICHVTDVFAYQPGSHPRDTPNNLVRVFMRAWQISPVEAVTACVELIHEDIRTFILLGAKLPRWGEAHDAVVGRYIEGMGAMMRGSLEGARLARGGLTTTSSPGEPRLERRSQTN